MIKNESPPTSKTKVTSNIDENNNEISNRDNNNNSNSSGSSNGNSIDDSNNNNDITNELNSALDTLIINKENIGTYIIGSSIPLIQQQHNEHISNNGNNSNSNSHNNSKSSSPLSTSSTPSRKLKSKYKNSPPLLSNDYYGDNDDDNNDNDDEEENTISSVGAGNGNGVQILETYNLDYELPPSSSNKSIKNMIKSTLSNSNGNKQSPITSQKSSKSSKIEDVEDDGSGEDMLLVDRMIGYKSTTGKQILYWCSIIFTFGVALLIYYWFELLYVRVRYQITPTLSNSTWVLIYSKDSRYEFCQVLKTSSSTKYLIYRFSRFFFNEESGEFEKSKLNNYYEKSKLLELIEIGLDCSSLVHLQERFGLNEINFPVKNIPKLLMEEVLHPFFIFQIYSVCLWFAEEYYYYAIAILLIATVSAVISLKEIRGNLLSLQKIAHFTCPVNVLRDNGKMETIESTELVPGDIIELHQGFILPCDVILLCGQTILNESMLTGESIPVTKYSVLTDEEIKYYRNNNKQSLLGGEDDRKDLSKERRSLLFGGTIIVKLLSTSNDTTNTSSNKVLGMVRNTSFQTTKGKLVLSILYPKKSHFKFFSESLKFIGVLCCLALVGFVISVWRLETLGVDTHTMTLRALDLITIVIPPALPMAMTVGTGFGLSRLRKSKIYCISPQRLNMAGKIQVFCFDKTGTLTEEGLDLLGILTTSQIINNNGILSNNTSTPSSPKQQHLSSNNLLNSTQQFKFNSMIDPNKESFNNNQSILRVLMASCHSLSMIDEVVSGDPLEIKIFQSTNSKILDSSTTGGSGQSISIASNEFIQEETIVNYLENFDFQSKLQRMSVIVQLQSTGKCMSLVKGSPEMIKGLCLPWSLPSDYDSQLSVYTEKGYRVLACAYKNWDPTIIYAKRELLRQQSESNLIFLGFIIMENRIKQQSASIISTLQKANIRTIMVTGDNPLTATCVAKQCGIIRPDSLLFIGKIDSNDPNNELVWDQVVSSSESGESCSSSNNGIHYLDPSTLLLDGSDSNTIGGRNYNLIITGPVFKQIYNQYLSSGSIKFINMLKRGIVYSRMTPDEKQTLVEELQRVGLYVGMCGDGANDCGALKAAHVGISLSESEASIAAPFTSTITDISCCPILIREGRASLAVSFKLFQFMGMYSLIQFFSCLLVYFESSVLGNWMYLYQDLYVIFPLVVFLGMTKPCNKLSIKRPSGRLISGAIVGSLLVHILVCVAYSTGIFLLVKRQSWYTEHGPNNEFLDNSIFHYVTTSIFIFGSFQYLIMLLTFSFGKPFLKPFYTNKWLFIVYLVTLTTTFLILFVPVESIWKFGQLLIVPVAWRFTILGFVIANLISNIIVEFVFFIYKQKKSKKKVLNITQIFTKDAPKDNRISENSVLIPIHDK